MIVMTYQQASFGNGEFHHVVNRGVEKRITFLDSRNYQRFLETMEYYRFQNPPTRFSFRNRPNIFKKSGGNEVLVKIICFCLMPNHFHLLLKQVKENSVSAFLSKLTNSYTKYFNIKHKRVGPLFQGSFKAVRIEDDEQLVHTSRYIHLNPLIDYLVKDLRVYPYSSYRQFLSLEDGFCNTHYILDQFSSVKAYEKFVLDQEEYGRTIKKIERLLLED